MTKSRYNEFISGQKTVVINGIRNDMWADPDDYNDFTKIAVENQENPDLSRLIDFAVKIIKKGTPKEEVAEPKFEEGLRRYLWENVKDLSNEILIAFNFTTREELERLEKEAREKLKKNEK